MVPFGVDTDSGAVGGPSVTLESSVKSLDPFSLLQDMVGPGIPVAVHTNVAVVLSVTVTTDSSGGSVISGATAGERERKKETSTQMVSGWNVQFTVSTAEADTFPAAVAATHV